MNLQKQLLKISYHSIALLVMLLFIKPVRSQSTDFDNTCMPSQALHLRQQMCLNGIWDFKSNAETEWRKIPVPGSYTGARQMWGGVVWDTWDYPVSWQNKGAQYKREFVLPEFMKGKHITFLCQGCAHITKVFVNGKLAGESFDGYNPFEFDITSLLKEGTNTLIVELSDEPSRLFSDQKSGLRGIWRDVWINAYNDLSVASDAFVSTYVKDSKIVMETPVINRSLKTKKFFIRHFVTDADNEVVLQFGAGWNSVKPQSSVTVKTDAPWGNARLWFPHDPYLYHMNTVIYDEQMNPVDLQKIRFGFREITWEGPNLQLNGRTLFLHGHGGHSQGDLQGSREYYMAWLSNLRKRGINFMRLHNDPKHRELYEVADELGMMLEAEPAFHFHVPEDTTFALQHLGNMVRSQRNHPSVILWSVSNELRWRGGGEKKFLIDYVKSLDTTRPVFASDFSLESRHGDVLGHHYNPKTVFKEWEQYGPGKAMIWDETSSVWQSDRPLSNGTAGIEVVAQDYATGLYRDGYEQLNSDISGAIDGQMINGVLHRPTAFVPWDFSYNFFRFQPVNKNRELAVHWDNYNTPGIKISKIKPGASTINIWDPTLPVMEPNPGYYLFKKHLEQVRFHDSNEVAAVFGGSTFVVNSKLYYEDLRSVDFIACIVESSDGNIYTKTTKPFSVQPGEIIDNLSFEFAIPEVSKPVKAKLTREFRYRNEAGYRVSNNITIYPELKKTGIKGLNTASIGIFGSDDNLKKVLDDLSVNYTIIKDWKQLAKKPEIDVLLSTGQTNHTEFSEKFLANGGRWLIFAEKDGKVADMQLERFIENFSGNPGTFSEENPFTSEYTGFAWKAIHDTNDTASISKRTLVDQFNSLSVESKSGKPVYVSTEFVKNGAHYYLSDPGKRILYIHVINNQSVNKEISRAPVKHLRLVIKDADNKWLISKTSVEFPLDVRKPVIKILPDTLQWLTFNPENLPENLIPGQEKSPDFEKIRGLGFFFNAETHGTSEITIPNIEWSGQGFPKSIIPLNGAKHKLLKNIEQQQLTRWRDGSCNTILDVPFKQFNCRNILFGNKDGIGSSLFEENIGKGLQVSTSLNLLNNLETEPAAAQLFKNMLEYAIDYQPGNKVAKTVYWGGNETRQLLDNVSLVYENKLGLTSCNVLIIDAQSKDAIANTKKHSKVIRNFVTNGGHVLVSRMEENGLDVFKPLINDNLSLTEPFRNQRSHCVKAATSWTLRNTPANLVEYYDGVLIPQPFEPNLDPLLTGIANNDLQWSGTPMFDKGIEIKGMKLLDPTQDATILISNWQIDWSRPDLFGEYINEARDGQRAAWFVNRDAVVLKIKYGSGYFIINQLDFTKGGEKGARVLAQLLNGIGCSIGVPTNIPSQNIVFDNALNADQIKRFESTKHLLTPVQREYYGPSTQLNGVFFPTRSKGSVSLPKLFIYYDRIMNATLYDIRKKSKARVQAFWGDVPLGSTRNLLAEVPKIAEKFDYPIIQISVGIEDLKNVNGANAVSLEEFKNNLIKIVSELKKTKAKIYWTSILPISRQISDYNGSDVKAYNQAAMEIMNDNGVYTIDLYDFVMKNYPEYSKGNSLQLTAKQVESISTLVADGILHFGAQF
jgi:hypothetical protein